MKMLDSSITELYNLFHRYIGFQSQNKNLIQHTWEPLQVLV